VGENPTISDKEYQQQSISKQASKEQDESEYGGGGNDVYAPVSTPTPGNEQYEQQNLQSEYDNGQYDQQQYDNTANAEQYDQQQYDDQQYQDQQNFGAVDYQQPAYDDQQQYAGEYGDQTAYDDGGQQQQQPYPGEYEPVQSEQNLGYATGAGGENEYQQQPE
jgi:hypothetical protein